MYHIFIKNLLIAHFKFPLRRIWILYLDQELSQSDIVCTRSLKLEGYVVKLNQPKSPIFKYKTGCLKVSIYAVYLCHFPVNITPGLMLTEIDNKQLIVDKQQSSWLWQRLWISPKEHKSCWGMLVRVVRHNKWWSIDPEPGDTYSGLLGRFLTTSGPCYPAWTPGITLPGIMRRSHYRVWFNRPLLAESEPCLSTVVYSDHGSTRQVNGQTARI